MLTVLVAALAGLLVFAITAWLFSPIAGIVPALIAFVGVGIVLLRRIGTVVETEVGKVQGMLQGGGGRETQADVDARVSGARAHLLAVKKRWGRWQIGLETQIDALLGMIEYARMKWDVARPLLQSGANRNWLANTFLGCLNYREGKKEAAWKAFESAAEAGPKEVTLYLVWAVLLLRDAQREEALKAIGKGLAELAGNDRLVALQGAIANKKKVDAHEVVGDTWWQFFPEEYQQLQLQQQLMRGRRDGGGPSPLVQPRFGARHAPRR